MEQDTDIRTPVITKIFPQFLDTLLLHQAFLVFHSDSVERVVAVKKPTSSCVFQWQVCVRCTKSSWTCDETQSWDRRKWKLHQLPEDCIWYRVSFLTEDVSLQNSQNCFGICSFLEVTFATLWKSLAVFRFKGRNRTQKRADISKFNFTFKMTEFTCKKFQISKFMWHSKHGWNVHNL